MVLRRNACVCEIAVSFLFTLKSISFLPILGEVGHSGGSGTQEWQVFDSSPASIHRHYSDCLVSNKGSSWRGIYPLFLAHLLLLHFSYHPCDVLRSKVLFPLKIILVLFLTPAKYKHASFSCSVEFLQVSCRAHLQQAVACCTIDSYVMGLPEEAANTPVDIPAPTILVVIRTSKLKPFGSLNVLSGIYKEPRNGRLKVDKVGLPEDEHDLTFHGGPDKAIHQYCSDHYPLWQELYPDPEVSARFIPGGFGENLVANGWNEKNVCIGDLVRIGPAGSTETGGDNGCVLEVSLPRQPCYKLNQKFGLKNFAPRTHQLARTGWYYRVVKEGSIEKGMELSIIERRWPKWTIERLHYYVHKDKENWGVYGELAQTKEIGMECRGVFINRLKAKDEEAIEKAKPVELWREFKLVEKKIETPRIVSLILEAVEKNEVASSISHGSYVHLRLPNGLLRSYSVVAGTTNRFELGIARDANSRGGSKYIHDNLKVGDVISVGNIVQSLLANSMASNHIMIVGGIGITAVLRMAQALKNVNYAFELHYSVRDRGDIAFKEQIDALGDQVHIYDKSKGERLNLLSFLEKRSWNSHIYVCGPQRMVDDAMVSSKAAGMGDDEVHVEAFQVAAGGDPFTADVETVNGKIKTVEITEKQTLLEVMREAGFDVPSSCEVGNCGTCKVRVKRGQVEHRGTSLTEEEKNSGEMLSCVSRGIGTICIDFSEE
jgi:MOSC domain-containing protein YiiM/ferredoxin-NADP reductase